MPAAWLVFSNGVDQNVQIGPATGEVSAMRTFDDFFNAYKAQMNYMIALMVNADNAIDVAHTPSVRPSLPFFL